MTINNHVDIVRSIHQKMSKKHKLIVLENLLTNGFKDLKLKEVNLDVPINFCLKNNNLSTNIKFEKSKQMLNVDLVIVKDNTLYLYDLKFTKKIDRADVLKSLGNLKQVKDWLLKNGFNQDVDFACVYWGRQKKVKSINKLLTGSDFCNMFNIDLVVLENQIKLEVENLVKERLDSVQANSEGFKLLMSDEMSKYKTAKEFNEQESLF